MASTLVGVIYDEASRQVRRIIVPADDAELGDGTHPLQDGEAQIDLPQNSYNIPLQLEDLEAIIHLIMGG